MKRTLCIALGTVLVAACFCTAFAQNPSDYALALAPGWERTDFQDGAKVERTEYIYGDRSLGLLKVKRVRLDSGESIDGYVAKDVSLTLRFLPGYVAGRQEHFAGGTMRGSMVEFDFTRGGKPMLGRYYYLGDADPSTIWILQFTGDRLKLAEIRNTTDQMARSFKAT